MRSLWRQWPRVRSRIAGRGRVIFLLDFDGTLAPLASAPCRTRLPERIRVLLRRLRARPRVTVAVLSGRPLSYVRSSVGLPSLYYGGNHGLEISGPGVSFRHPGATSAGALMQSLAGRLRTDLRSAPGAIVENKGPTLSVHYRRVTGARLSGFKRSLRSLRRRTSALPLRWSAGHKVWEVLPRVAWNKGAAALYLIRRLRHPYPIAVGDDRTDEDLFAALKGKGLSIRVGRKRSSRADYYLSGQGQVAEFLALACTAMADEA